MKSVEITETKIWRGVTYSPGEDVSVPDDFPEEDGDGGPAPIKGAEKKPPVTDRVPVGSHVDGEKITRPQSMITRAGEKQVGLSEIPAGSSGSGIPLEHAPQNAVVNDGAPADIKAGVAAAKGAETSRKESLSEAQAGAKEEGTKLPADAGKSPTGTIGKQ